MNERAEDFKCFTFQMQNLHVWRIDYLKNQSSNEVEREFLIEKYIYKISLSATQLVSTYCVICFQNLDDLLSLLIKVYCLNPQEKALPSETSEVCSHH